MSFTLNSPAFPDGQTIPKKYTGEGENVSPPLEWSNAPRDAQSFLLIIEDPDAPNGTFRHWAVYDIDGRRAALPEGLVAGDGIKLGVNDYGNRRYDGPAPPPGHGTHHYHFRMAALRTPHLDVPATATVAEAWQAAQPHIIDEAELVGTYAR